MHPLVAHFLIILLLAAPFLVMVGIGLPPEKRRLLLGATLAVMALGTATTFLAFATGEAAMAAASSTPHFRVVLEEHKALAETTRDLFSVLTLGLAVLLFAPRLLKRDLEPLVDRALLVIYLVYYATGALFLVHTALQGGQLVRELEAKTATTYQMSEKESVR